MKSSLATIRARLLLFAAVSVTATILVAVGGAALTRLTHQGDTALTRRVSAGYRNSHAALEKLVTTQSQLQSMLRLKDPDEIEQAMKKYDAASAAALAAVADQAEVRTQVAAVEAAGKAVLGEVLTGNNAGALERYVGQYNPKFEQALQALRKATAAIEENAQGEIATREASIQRLFLGSALGIAVFVVLAAFLAWRFQLAISRPLSRVATQLTAAADDSPTPSRPPAAASPRAPRVRPPASRKPAPPSRRSPA